jgi:hypothetical protein
MYASKLITTYICHYKKITHIDISVPSIILGLSLNYWWILKPIKLK